MTLALPIVMRNGKPHIDWLGRLVPMKGLTPARRTGLGRPIKDMRGMRFGRLVVFKLAGVSPKNRQAYWDALCDCSRKSTVSGSHLRNGQVKSCGCAHSDAGKVNMPKARAARWPKLVHAA